MNNQDRRKIVNQAKADGYQGSYVDLFKQAAQDPAMVANTPEQKQAGLRPFHEQGKTDASMAFPDTPPNTPFNTVGMKAPIDIKKFDEQGHLVKSYDAVPPGLTNIDSGPAKGTVLETPARMQYGGYNPGEYMNEMQPKVFPNQQRDAQWVNYATEHDFAGRFPGETRTNEQIGLQRSNRNTVPLPPNPVGAKELRIKAQEGAFNIDPRLQNRIEAPQPQRTFLKPDNRSDRERAAADERFKADRKREEAIERGVNPNTAFMTPPGLGADNEARAAYEYDNPATSNIGQIAGGIGFLPIDRGLDIAMTAAGSAIRSGIDKFDANTLASLQKQNTSRLAEKVRTRDVDAYKNFKSEVDWKKWNPDTPNHPELMDEYKHIEYTTKSNGTWMKNADGSPYKGSAEQFIQENSSHFKKAFPEGAYRTSRGIKIDPTEIDPLTGKTYPDMDIDPGFGYKTVFSADPGLASTPYYSGWGQPERFTPFSKRNWGKPQGFVADLYAKESPNSYRIVSQGDHWKNLRISGAPKDEIERRLTSQKIGLDIEKGKPAQYQNKSKINQLETEISRYEWFAKNHDKVVNKTPSKVPDFEQIAKEKFGSSVQTDFLGDLGYKKGLDDIRMFGLNDGDWGAHVNIHMNRPGNFLKSSTGNVGFFDMKSDDIFKAAAPIGIGAGLMSQRKDGGYKKAQKGSVVDYLLPALEANNPTEFADTQASNQAKVVSKSEQDLSAEQQRVEDVRANVIPTAENLAQLNSDIKYSNNIFGAGDSQYRPHLSHFDKMKKAKTPEEYKALEKEAKKSYPELIEAIPENNIMVMNPGKYKADDELYCTPYGCYTYDKAGATDVPEYSGNYGFVGGTKNGKNPFQKISGDEAVPGDIGLMLEYSPVDYRDPSKGKTLRPHHTTILSEKTDDPQVIKAYSAIDGQRLNFMEGLLKAEDKRDKEGNKHEGRWDYYRYIGQTPYMQRAVGNAKHNQRQADMVAQAMQQQAEVASQLPDRDLTNVETIGRRDAAKIEGNDISQDIVNITTEIPEQRKSGKQKVEELSNAVQGKVETAKERRARIKAINKRTRQNIKNIRKG
jgi:hypothetical protein